MFHNSPLYILYSCLKQYSSLSQSLRPEQLCSVHIITSSLATLSPATGREGKELGLKLPL